MPTAIKFLRRVFDRRTDRAGDVHAPLLNDTELGEIIRRVHAAQNIAHYHRDVLTWNSGDARSAHLGRGLDFEESRLYQRGDDVRAMDWRTTARTGKPHLKIYREERQPVLHVVIDRGASMRFGTRTQLKVTQAARLAVLYAYAAVRDNTCIGGTLWQPSETILQCRKGEEGALQLARAAISACPPLEQTGGKRPSFSDLCNTLNGSLPLGSRIVFIGDFAQLSGTDLPALLTLAACHEVRALQILDAAERDMPDIGLMRFADLATGNTGWLDTGAASLRSDYRHQAAASHQHRRALLERAGIPLAVCMTHDDPFDVWMASLQ